MIISSLALCSQLTWVHRLGVMMDAGRKILRMEEDLQEMVDAYNAWARRCRDITRAAPVLLPFADSALATLLADWVCAHEYCLSVFFLVRLHSAAHASDYCRHTPSCQQGQVVR